MLIETKDAYIYGEKHYKEKKLISSLSIEIFKKQKFKSLNFNQIRMLIANQFNIDTFDEIKLTKYLRKKKFIIIDG